MDSENDEVIEVIEVIGEQDPLLEQSDDQSPQVQQQDQHSMDILAIATNWLITGLMIFEGGVSMMHVGVDGDTNDFKKYFAQAAARFFLGIMYGVQKKYKEPVLLVANALMFAVLFQEEVAFSEQAAFGPLTTPQANVSVDYSPPFPPLHPHPSNQTDVDGSTSSGMLFLYAFFYASAIASRAFLNMHASFEISPDEYREDIRFRMPFNVAEFSLMLTTVILYTIFWRSDAEVLIDCQTRGILFYLGFLILAMMANPLSGSPLARCDTAYFRVMPGFLFLKKAAYFVLAALMIVDDVSAAEAREAISTMPLKYGVLFLIGLVELAEEHPKTTLKLRNMIERACSKFSSSYSFFSTNSVMPHYENEPLVSREAR